MRIPIPSPLVSPPRSSDGADRAVRCRGASSQTAHVRRQDGPPLLPATAMTEGRHPGLRGVRAPRGARWNGSATWTASGNIVSNTLRYGPDRSSVAHSIRFTPRLHLEPRAGLVPGGIIRVASRTPTRRAPPTGSGRQAEDLPRPVEPRNQCIDVVLSGVHVERRTCR